jgi:hypothetical protein
MDTKNQTVEEKREPVKVQLSYQHSRVALSTNDTEVASITCCSTSEAKRTVKLLKDLISAGGELELDV